MQAKVEVITLAYAKQLLEQNPTNRPISEKTVQRYANDMKAGRWLNNGQSIVVAENGELLDGQHRLHAIIVAQTPISALVVRNVPRNTFATMDSGKPRSLADVLAIEGYDHANTLAAAARLVYNYVAGVTLQNAPTKAALNGFILKHTYCAEAVKLVTGGKTNFPKGALAAVVWLGNERGTLSEEAQQFVEGLVYGEGLFKGDARHTLREWARFHRDQNRNFMSTKVAFGAIVRAWNAYASGKELLQIKGITNPSQASMKVYGFERSTYPDVPDLIAAAAETRLNNLSRARSNLPKRLATPALKLGAAA